MIAGRGEGGLRIERGRVEHPSVGSNTHRRDRPVRIAAITLLQLFQNRRVYRRVAARPQLLEAPPRALRIAGGDEQLEGRVRADDGADVAAGQHRAAPVGAELALERQERRAHAPARPPRSRLPARSPRRAAGRARRPAVPAPSPPPRPPPRR